MFSSVNLNILKAFMGDFMDGIVSPRIPVLKPNSQCDCLVTELTAAAGKSLQSCLTLFDPIDSSLQAPPSTGFSRQEHWSGLPFPSPQSPQGGN